jgi:preprotein translocase subunit YajC
MVEGVAPYVMTEAVFVVVLAAVLAIAITFLLARAARQKKQNMIQLKGELGNLSWVYTSTGQVAVFVGVFLVIITVYILLRSMPST